MANGYQKALDALRNNAPQQAYSRLEKVVAKDSKNEKAEKLHQNLGYLLKAKKAVTEDKLTKTGEYLAKLDRVNTPKSLVKQINAVKKEYQSAKLARVYYAEVGDYYNAQKISAAGGSLEALKSLPSRYQAVAAYQSKAQKYEDLIAQAQSASTGTTPDSSSNSSSTSAASTTDNSTAGTQASSGYTNARSSKIVSSEYEKKTGSSISSATNSQVSSVANGLTDTEVLAKFRAAAGIPQEAGDQYYIQKIDSDSYQIEIRHTSPNNTAVSNLKGMYRFAVSTQVVQKMNEVSGEYVQVN
ncbi:lipoprotein [Liquorilactobacillus uvarum DSM 19971]|uniref:Lipoprotein n=1 Tax=Liquorilactobacillus uvarum DSM 19971 TaxID=1423812 RepID=A0A0R1Q5Y9_9LACO|nr:lipoprotein [Liquorilactobacillus uvarum DSM 19971]